ncbi:MAG: hypothetical protein WKG52_14265 [Variovorax sp.]
MNRILIKRRQTITLFLAHDEQYEFLLNDIAADEAVFVLFDKRTRRLVIASCTADILGSVNLLLLNSRLNAGCTVWLVSGAKKPLELCETFVACINARGLKCGVIDGHGNLHITQGPDGTLKLANATPATGFTSFDREHDGEVTSLLHSYGDVSATSIRDQAQNLLMQTMTADEDDATPEPEDEVVDFAKKQQMVARMLENVDQRQRPVSRHDKKAQAEVKDDPAINAALARAAFPETYLVKLWQTAVINLVGDRKVKTDTLKTGYTAFAVCDETTRTLALSLVGEEAATSQAVSDIFERAMLHVTMPGKKQSRQPKLVYEIVAPENTAVASMLKNLINTRAKDAMQGKFGITKPTQQYCTYTSFFAEFVDSKFRLTDAEKLKPLPPEYTAVTRSLRSETKRALNALELPQDPQVVRFKDYLNVLETPIMVELAPGICYEVDLTSTQCLIPLKEKTIVFASFCAHKQKLAIVQLTTDEFEKLLLSKFVTFANWTLMNALSNFPEDGKGTLLQSMLWCKAPQLGHAKDAELCKKYIEAFPKQYAEYYGLAGPMYMKRAGTKFNLQKLGVPVLQHYDDITGYLSLRIELAQLKTEFRATALPLKKPEPGGAKAAKSVEITTPLIKLPAQVTDESSAREFYGPLGIKIAPITRRADKYLTAAETAQANAKIDAERAARRAKEKTK